MNQQTSIQEADVKQVAASIKQNLTEVEIGEVIKRYDSAQEQDPTENWSLIVESIVYEIVSERK